MLASTTTLSDAGTPGKASLRCKLHNHDLSCSEESYQVFIGASKIQEQCKTFCYPYVFETSDEMPKRLSTFYTSRFYACYSRPMRSVSVSAGSEPASFAVSHSPVVADVESCSKNVFEVFVDDDITGSEVAAGPFDLQIYIRKEVLLTTFGTDKGQKPLRAVLQKHENDLLKSLRVYQYQYGHGLMTVASPSSGTFGAVNVETTIENRWKERFLKEKFLLAVVNGPHRRSCIQKLATSTQPGLKRAPQPNRMTLITSAESEVLTDLELNQLISSFSMLSRIVL